MADENRTPLLEVEMSGMHGWVVISTEELAERRLEDPKTPYGLAYGRVWAPPRTTPKFKHDEGQENEDEQRKNVAKNDGGKHERVRQDKGGTRSAEGEKENEGNV